MHQAGHIAAGENIGLSVEDMIHLECAHAARYMREGDRKGAAEAATLLTLAERDDLHVADGTEEFEDGLAAVRAARVAGAVEGDTRRLRQGARPCFDSESVADEIHYFPCAAG